MNKQAILIIYHTDYYILKHLLKQIDSKYFDIYLHVDKKTKNFDFEKTKKLVNKSNIYFINRINVKWSTYSQIKCELMLLQEATKKNYMYYHLISGNDLLLKKPEEIYNFFKENYNKEFVAYKSKFDITESELERIKYYHILNGGRRHKNKLLRSISNKIYYNFLKLQKKININRLKQNNLEIRKGSNWFSITNELALYILNNRKNIKKMYKHSNCADELFLQTLVINSHFKNSIYSKYNDEHKNIKRCIDWTRGEPYTYTSADYEELINSNCFFARKFSSKKDQKIIDEIFKNSTK